MGRRFLWWSASLAGALAIVLLALGPPVGDGLVLCLFRRALDLPCPGCGLTRAFAHMAQGDLDAALRLHPLSPLLGAEIVLGWVLLGLAAHGVALPPGRLGIDRWLVATGYLLLAVWMGRLAIGDLTAVLP